MDVHKTKKTISRFKDIAYHKICRCNSGLCITKRWLCDGYSDCPDGDDEHEDLCQRTNFRGAITDEAEVGEPGEELAGSAPEPSVRKPNRIPTRDRSQGIRNGTL